MDGIQGGSGGGDIFGTIMQVIEGVLNPIKGIESLIKACSGGNDSVSQSQAQTASSSGATTEMYNPNEFPGYAQGKGTDADAEMSKKLDIIEQNWDLFDSGNGKSKPDGKVSMLELAQIANDPSLPLELREAAKKVIDSPWLMNKLDQGRWGGTLDGSFTKDDVKWFKGTIASSASPAQQSAASAAQQSPAQSSALQDAAQKTPEKTDAAAPDAFIDAAQQSANNDDFSSGREVAQSQSAMTSVLDDDSIGFEAKTNYVCSEMMQGAEDQAVDAYRGYEDAYDKLKSAKTEQEVALANAEVSRLNSRVQQAMQRRQEMYQLVSNINTMSHDMAMSAIRNMKD